MTRFYLPSAGSPPLVPAYYYPWDSGGETTYGPLVTTKTNTSIAGFTITKTASGNGDKFTRIFVSEPIAAQTITGTCTFAVRGSESASAANAYPRARVHVITGDGSALRGTLVNPMTSATELTTTAQRRTASVSVSTVAAQAGDRLLVEFGNLFATSATGYTASLFFGDNSTTDMTAGDGTGGSTDNPWIELSHTVTFYTPPTAQATVTKDWNGNLVAIKRWSDA